MLTLVKYRPLAAPEVLDRVYDARRAHRANFALPVDVRAEGDDYLLTAAVPGLKAEAVTVEVLGDSVTVTADLTPPPTADATTWLVQERRYGKFSRTLNFPAALDSAQAEAQVADGVLTLRLPKAETARPKVIKVSAH